MAYQDQIQGKELRDLLTQEELSEIQNLKGFPLICVWSKEKAHTDQTGFKGYFPLNAKVSEGITPHRLEDQSLDILRDFCSGG
jgi:hypothetical protein